MRLTNHSSVPVYTVSGSTARALPDWLVRKRNQTLKKDPEFASRIELLQDFEFEEASCCVRASEDGQWVMSTGKVSLGAKYGYLWRRTLVVVAVLDARLRRGLSRV